MTKLSLPGKIAIGLLVASSSACEGLLDVNENPNAPEQVSENLILPAITGIFGFGVLGSWPATLGAEWTQQISYNGERGNMKIEKYEINESEADRLWTTSYTDVMNESRRLAELAESNGNYAYAGMAKLLLAWNLSVLTDMWGPIPYEEAFDPTNPTPGYDSQEEIYATVHRLLGEAIADLDRGGPRAPTRDDLLYGGNLVRWRRLAHTVQARLHLQLANAPGQSAANRAQLALAALQNGFASNADDADFRFYNVANQRNPWYRARLDTRVQMSEFYVNLLKESNDPRLAVQAQPADSLRPGPIYAGHRNGEPAVIVGNVSAIGNFYAAPAAVHTWISYAEAKFIEAEARLITQGAAAADPAYRDAIRAHMQKLGIGAAAIQAYVQARPPLASVQNPLREIITQKYIANFLNYQAYNDWRRTGYPELRPVREGVIDVIPVRLRTPGSELANNLASVQATGIPLGLEGMKVRVWWDPQ